MKKFQIFKKTKTLLLTFAYNDNIQADLRGKWTLQKTKLLMVFGQT